MIPNKACPVVLNGSARERILVFEHPLAGIQLVKGSIEPNESPVAAAVRELQEESGLRASAVLADLGTWVPGYGDQVWSFQLCEVQEPLPEGWSHRCADDGGHDFRFFWHPLDEVPTPQWHWVFREALVHVRRALGDTYK
ncbi:hypothetical protein PSEWESI4_02671 [Pseudomonas carbonaria]|uniref:Nudix hydrolase domain-containing protein n=1 Tax=Zestomonas carbonaria TaxID=2762745 RepID=A0A7U7I9N9_9GAMM|nr:hypothetical protein PSEWESI4_02671 [Pseudomonas carbonaria]